MPRFAAGENIDGKLIPVEASDIKEAHIKALDDLVSVNNFFAVAIFIGLSMAARGQQSIEIRTECQAGVEYKKMLLLYEVLAFACFVLSSLVAKVIKLHLIIHGYRFVDRNFDWKDFLLILSAGSSIAGIVLVTLSVVVIIQIRMGLLSCGSAIAWWSVWSVSMIVGIGLVIYVVSMIVAITTSIKSDKHALFKSDQAKNIGDDQDSGCVQTQTACSVIQLAAPVDG